VQGVLAPGAGSCAFCTSRPDCLCARCSCRSRPDLLRWRKAWPLSSAASHQHSEPSVSLSGRGPQHSAPRGFPSHCLARSRARRVLPLPSALRACVVRCATALMRGAAHTRRRHWRSDMAPRLTHGRPGRHPAPADSPLGGECAAIVRAMHPEARSPRARIVAFKAEQACGRLLATACCSGVRQARLPAAMLSVVTPCAAPRLRRPLTREHARRCAGG
jgi:hypothetical protein